jgi:hypothetical protein
MKTSVKSARRLFELGGVVAAVVLIAFGIGAIVIGTNGLNTVNSSLAQQQITGSPDMTPKAIAAAGQKAGLGKNVGYPTCTVAGQVVNNGTKARCFAGYMRIHTLEATGGQNYSAMGMYLNAAGKPTSDKTAAAIDPTTGKPMANHARDIWVTETALTTALNTSYMAQQTATFGIVMGVALLLVGLGFSVLVVGGSLRRDPAAS